MNIKQLEEKYGKKLISKIIKEGYLDGCTIVINKDGSTKDIPEEDIINAIKEMKGLPYDWD